MHLKVKLIPYNLNIRQKAGIRGGEGVRWGGGYFFLGKMGKKDKKRGGGVAELIVEISD